jgi:hypothetical protein
MKEFNQSETAINIVYYSEIIDNWGRTESSSKISRIYDVLKDPECWNGDMIFEDDKRQVYLIDDLIGKKVSIHGHGRVLVEIKE